MVNPWPAVLVPSSEAWRANTGSGRSGGRTMSGQEQVVSDPSGYATASLTLQCLRTEQVMAMRGVIELGRAATWLIGPFEYARAPWARDAYGRLIVPALLRRRDLDGTVYADPVPRALADTLLPARLEAAVAMNATACRIRMPIGTAFRSDVVATTPGVLAIGHLFELGGRLHAITAITAVAGEVSDVQFRPWARADYPAATAVNLVSPKSTMRLASNDTGAMALALSRGGSVSVDLVEAS